MNQLSSAGRFTAALLTVVCIGAVFSGPALAAKKSPPPTVASATTVASTKKAKKAKVATTTVTTQAKVAKVKPSAAPGSAKPTLPVAPQVTKASAVTKATTASVKVSTRTATTVGSTAAVASGTPAAGRFCKVADKGTKAKDAKGQLLTCTVDANGRARWKK